MTSIRACFAALLAAAVVACGGGSSFGSRPTWQPPAGATPSSGSYVYLESESNDKIGQGRNYLYTQTTSTTILMTTSGARISFSVQGAENWNGDFEVSDNGNLIVGFWGDLPIYPPPTPGEGGLLWSGEGRSCSVVSGWFVIDRVGFRAGRVSLVEMRFEQRCDGGASVLRGKIRIET